MQQRAENSSITEHYKPRDGRTGNKNAFRFTEEQMTWIKTELSECLDFFEYNSGHTAYFTDIENSTESKFRDVNKSI